jgi:hypothetical protein
MQSVEAIKIFAGPDSDKAVIDLYEKERQFANTRSALL